MHHRRRASMLKLKLKVALRVAAVRLRLNRQTASERLGLWHFGLSGAEPNNDFMKSKKKNK